MKYNQQHLVAIYVPSVKAPKVLTSRSFFYSFTGALFTRGIVLQSLLLTVFFSTGCSGAPHQLEDELEPAACTIQKIQQQQRNAPGQLIKTDSNSLSAQLAVHTLGHTVRQYRYKIIRRLPHSTTAFTQGLAFYDNYLFEGTGLLGKSEIRKLETETGKLLKSVKTDRLAFGEGISIKNNRLIQLSWKSEKAYIYDVETFRLINEVKYKGEGWGIACINDNILISDGSSFLKWFDAERFSGAYESRPPGVSINGIADSSDNVKNKNIRVMASGVEVQGINELEYANGFIYANIWPTDCIAEIDPSTGNVTAWINLADLYPAKSRTDWNAVLNGIAYQQDSNVFYVTGKYWPYIYVIALQQPGTTQLNRAEAEKAGSIQAENSQRDVFASLQN